MMKCSKGKLKLREQSFLVEHSSMSFFPKLMISYTSNTTNVNANIIVIVKYTFLKTGGRYFVYIYVLHLFANVVAGSPVHWFKGAACCTCTHSTIMKYLSAVFEKV